jgi:hypothetical protein
MKGFDISIKNELLEKKHFVAMGKAVWLYIFLVDKITSVDEKQVGTVLGGKPLVFEKDIHETFPITRQTYYKWIEQLEKYPYIETKRTPYGISFRVFKAHKVFGTRSKENVTSRSKQNLTSGVNKTLHGCKQNLTSNIRQYKDNTKTIGKKEKSDGYKKALAIRNKLKQKLAL